MDAKSLIKLSTQLLQIGDESPNYIVEITKNDGSNDDPYRFTGDEGGAISVEVQSGEDNGADTATVIFQNVDGQKFLSEVNHYRKDVVIITKVGGLYINPDFQKILLGETFKLEAFLVTNKGHLNVTESSRTVWSTTPGVTISKGVVQSTSTQGEFIVTATYSNPTIVDANNETIHNWTATTTVVICEKSYDVYDSIIKIKPYDEEDIDGDAIRITLNNQIIQSDLSLQGPNEAPIFTLNLKPGLNVLKVGARGSGRQYLLNKANNNLGIQQWADYKAWIDAGSIESQEPPLDYSSRPNSANDSTSPGVTSNVTIYNSDDDIILAADQNKKFQLFYEQKSFWYVNPDQHFLIWTFVNYDIPAKPIIPTIPPDPIYLEHLPPYYKLFAPENKIQIFLGYEEIIPPVLTGAIDKIEIDSDAKTLTIQCRDNMRYLIDQSIDSLRFGLALTYPRRDIKIQQPASVTDATKKVVVVNGMDVNIRVGPGTSYNKIGKANSGDTFAYISTTGAWHNIRYNGQSAYISSTYSTIETISINVQTGNWIIRAKTNGSNLNVRIQPNTSAKIIGVIANNGTAVYLDTSLDNNWYKIWRNDRDGWVSATWSVKEEGK